MKSLFLILTALTLSLAGAHTQAQEYLVRTGTILEIRADPAASVANQSNQARDRRSTGEAIGRILGAAAGARSGYYSYYTTTEIGGAVGQIAAGTAPARALTLVFVRLDEGKDIAVYHDSAHPLFAGQRVRVVSNATQARIVPE